MNGLVLFTGQYSAFLRCSMILTPKMLELLVLKGWSVEKVQLCQNSQASIWALKCIENMTGHPPVTLKAEYHA